MATDSTIVGRLIAIVRVLVGHYWTVFLVLIQPVYFSADSAMANFTASSIHSQMNCYYYRSAIFCSI